MSNEKRWQLRYENFKKALNQLKAAISQKTHSKLEIAGTIKTFEFSFELAWKTLKDFLEKEGFEVKTPRETIKQAFQSGFIENGRSWLEALDNRNLMSHTHDEEDSMKAFGLIKNGYFDLLTSLDKKLEKELSKCSD